MRNGQELVLNAIVRQKKKKDQNVGHWWSGMEGNPPPWDSGKVLGGTAVEVATL